jgi:hypothetical protein
VQRACAVGFGLLFIGIGGTGLISPRTAARGYGLPLDDPVGLAFVRAAAARDAIVGALLVASVADRRSVRRTLTWLSLIGLVDGAILIQERGVQAQHVAHLGGFAALALAALSLGE